MFNVAVIRLKDLVKYLLLITGVLAVIILGKRYFVKMHLGNIDIGQKVSVNIDQCIEEAINFEMPGIKEVQRQEETEQLINENIENKDGELKNKILTKILGWELSAINAEEKIFDNSKVANNVDAQSEESTKEQENKKEDDSKGESSQKKEEKNDENIELAEKGVKTEVITKNPIAESYTQKYKSVKIKNETSFDLSDEDLNFDDLKIDKSNIIIFHTHTCESYTSSEQYSYTPTGNFRTTDLNYSVARVGDELTKYLKKYNMNVVHDKTYHDYPSYSGSYTRSLTTVSKILKSTKADIIIDLHRDAIGNYSSYAPTVKIGDDECAQVMFVMGSNGGGLSHSKWKTNLQFAVKMQEIGNKTYPGLFKPIILRNSRYNQHLGKAACIIEVGSTGNTLEQCLNSMKYLSEIINEF